MSITFEKKGKRIETFEQWEELGHPKSDKHWKPGRSAMEMARYAIEHTTEFESLIKDVLKQCGISEQDFICEPEANVSLGQGMKQGGPRNHDLLMLGSKDCVIGIEAKVSESFDESLEKAINKQSQKRKGNQEDTRAYQLLKFFVTSDSEEEKAKSIGYQLFSATRGAMQSALSQLYTKAIMLVVVFTGDVQKESNYDAHCNKNDEDFDAFIHVIRADKNGKIVRKVDKKEIECWIKKVKVNIFSSYSTEIKYNLINSEKL